ncbi:MAG TPA: zinc-dependent metalloprotease [Polyangia bacterium]|nr:zinc-dependent metalloprotease [Polyangia bacterium]
MTLAAACGMPPSVDSSSEVPDDVLGNGGDFIQVSREALSAAAPVGLGDGIGNFYLAIRRDALDRRWLLSAYMKQYHLGDAGVAAASTLGTRVVSFRVQNGKLYVFDASDAFAASALFDPEVLLEAYPIVHLASFERQRGADNYVLFDPAGGLNRFSVTGELFADPNLAQFGAFPLRVGLSFMQNFRSIPDGATYEQVFTGEVDLGAGVQTVWGTLGLSLRRYSVGEGFVPTIDPGVPHYFLSDFRLIPDSGFNVEANPVHWNLHPGMTPIKVSITQGIQRAQADFPDIDLMGALERGIESWNDVLGFPAFDAVFVDDDQVRDNDQSTVLVDYPGAGNPFAFADWRSNPNNGEIFGGSVYFGGIFFQILPLIFEDDPAPPAAAAAGLPRRRPAVPSLLWDAMPRARHACVYWAPPYQKRIGARVSGDNSLTAAEKGSRYIQHVMAHEWGHVLGLRHNFKGSLLPPTSSLMEYAVDADSVAQPTPGPYDVDAIRYLYQYTRALPRQPFCTDEDTQTDPNCVIFDSTADPLHEFWPPTYDLYTSLVLDAGLPLDFLEFGGLNEILGYARDLGSVPPDELVPPADRAFAAALAIGRAQVPLAPADAADADVVSRVNDMADFVLRRAVLDPPDLRGAISFDLSDPGAIAVISAQAGRMLRNEDGIRTYALRRTAVDTLKKLQAESAFLELRASQTALVAALAIGLPADQVPFEQDLLVRVVAALTPYFD